MSQSTKKIVLASALSTVLCLFQAPVCADESPIEEANEHTELKKFGFGFQMAPLTAGLSLKYNASLDWTFQGVISPDSDSPYLSFRGLRTVQRASFWKSYIFGSYAFGSQEYGYTDNDSEISESVLSAGMGMEWGWQSRGINRPPLFTSIELGLGYRVLDDTYDSSEDEDAILVLGAGLHYEF